MKINRLALKAAVQKTLDNSEAKHKEQVKAYADWLVTYKQEWIEEYNVQWGQACEKIRVAIRKGEPITKDMAPKGQYNDPPFYTDPEVSFRARYDTRPTKPTAEWRPSYELVALLEVLDLIVDDEVTPTGLQGLGITPKTLRDAILKLGTKSKIGG